MSFFNLPDKESRVLPIEKIRLFGRPIFPTFMDGNNYRAYLLGMSMIYGFFISLASSLLVVVLLVITPWPLQGAVLKFVDQSLYPAAMCLVFFVWPLFLITILHNREKIMLCPQPHLKFRDKFKYCLVLLISLILPFRLDALPFWYLGNGSSLDGAMAVYSYISFLAVYFAVTASVCFLVSTMFSFLILTSLRR